MTDREIEGDKLHMEGENQVQMFMLFKYHWNMSIYLIGGQEWVCVKLVSESFLSKS